MFFYAVFGLVFLLFVFFDVQYFARGALYTLVWRLRLWARRRHLLEQVALTGLCTTNDMDFAWRMNNSRYLKDCDFGRYQLFIENGIWDLTKTLGGSMATTGSCVRYRRSLYLFDRYKINTRVLCWDQKCFYLEHRVERSQDGFLCAIVLIKQTLINLSIDTLLHELTGSHVDSPPFPDDVTKWIESNQISSANLRKTS